MDLGPCGRLEEVAVPFIKLHPYRQRFRFRSVQFVPELACVVPDELFELGELADDIAATVPVVDAVARSGEPAEVGRAVGHRRGEVGVVLPHDDSVLLGRRRARDA